MNRPTINDLNPDQLKALLLDLQDLVDGNYTDAGDIVSNTGLDESRAKEILDSINLLKSIRIES